MVLVGLAPSIPLVVVSFPLRGGGGDGVERRPVLLFIVEQIIIVTITAIVGPQPIVQQSRERGPPWRRLFDRRDNRPRIFAPPANSINTTPHFRRPTPLSEVELEGFEAAIHSVTSRAHAHPPATLATDNGLDAGPTEPTNAIGTCITLFQVCKSTTARTVDLNRLTRELWV